MSVINRDHAFKKRVILYIMGIFLLGMGVTFFVFSDLGVPPIASFPYSITLTTGIPIGITTIIAHFIFIVIQIILTKKNDVRSFILQLIIAILFGLFIDLTSWFMGSLPEAKSYLLKFLYLTIGILSCAIALVLYLTAKLPMVPYDTLTYIIVEKVKKPFGKVRVLCDVSVVFISLTICLVGLHSFGSIGLGTLIGSYSIGKITGILMIRLQPLLQNWISSSKQENELKIQS